jgi:lysophospholipase L1-like esterase
MKHIKIFGDFLLESGGGFSTTDSLNLMNSILFVGDSITAAEFSYANLIKKEYPKKDIQVLAKGGMRTSWMLANLKPVLNQKHYDRVYIWGGVNDMFSAVTIEQAINNIQQMVNMVNAQKGEAFVIIGYDTEIFMDKDKLQTTKYVPTKEGMYKLRERYIIFQNRLEKEIRNAKIIKKFNLNSSYTADAIHPNPSAHKIIKSIILKSLGDLSDASNIVDDIKKIASKGKTYSNPSSITKPYDADVEYIQTALQHLGFFLPKWGIDGKFGEETEKAVKDFQTENNLAVSGSLSKEDLEVMTDELKNV